MHISRLHGLECAGNHQRRPKHRPRMCHGRLKYRWHCITHHITINTANTIHTGVVASRFWASWPLPGVCVPGTKKQLCPVNVYVTPLEDPGLATKYLIQCRTPAHTWYSTLTAKYAFLQIPWA